MEVVLEHPYVLIYDNKISNPKQLLPILEKIAQSNQPILIIADDVEGEGLGLLAMNKMRGALKVCAVKAPMFGERRKEQLDDIAILTGGTVISESKGFNIEKTELEFLGKCEKVVITNNTTIIVNGIGNKDMIEERIHQTKSLIKNTDSNYDKEKLKERLAKLTGGIAVLYVGAPTEVEMKEKKDRVEDALAATRAAIEEGIVPGGGVALVRATDKLAKLKGDNDDEQTGINIITRAAEEPLRQIVENAGLEGSVIVAKVREGKGDFGFNAKTEVYENLYKAGVIDPAKVVRVALENAASVAGMLLTTECVIAEIKENNPAMPAMGGGMPGMM
jgi:chaperonin GroEL